MLKQSVQGQHHIENVKSTYDWHDFEFQMNRFFHVVPKEEVCITSRNPLWRSVVYPRIMITAILWFALTVVDLIN